MPGGMRVNVTVMVLLLAGLVVSAVICVFLQNLLKACIALAGTSGIQAVIMFLVGAPMAAVFELSVCAGLVTVVFISAVSMTKVRSREDVAEEEKTRRKRFMLLPVLLAALLGGALFFLGPHLNELLPHAGLEGLPAAEPQVFWNERQADILGQIVIVLAGVFGVLIFFKESEGE